MSTTITRTASEVIEEILAHGLQHANDSARRPNLIANGAPSAQGDINIWKIDSLDDLPKLKESKPFYQLAPGNTRGSRHCLDADSVKDAKFFLLENPTALQGGVWVNEVETLVTHPEHGDQLLDPGIYFVTYQRQYAEELKRIAD
jgi:hypothetical protein